MGVFDGCQVTLELDSSVRFKEKLGLKKKVIDHGGIISFIVTKKTTHLIVNNVEKAQDSYKSRMAQKWKVPVLSVDYISKCVEAGKLLEADPFVVVGRTASEEFRSGKIVASLQDKANADKKKKRQKSSLNMNQLKVWAWPHQQDTGPGFPEDSYEVARHSFLKKFDSRTRKTSFVCLEIHVVLEVSAPLDPQTPRYRVFSHTGVLESRDAQTGSMGKKECRYTSCALDVEYVYTQLYNQHTSSPQGLIKVPFISSLVGSPRLQKFLSETQSVDSGQRLSPEVSALVDYIWTEVSGRLKDVLAVPVESVKVEQVDKAEAELLTIKRLLSDSVMEKAKKDAEIVAHSRTFYSSLPHKSTSPKDPPIKSVRMLAEKQDLCQLIRDIVAISESTNWSVRSGPEAKYRALRCDIDYLEPTSLEYANIRDHVLNSQDESLSGHMTIRGVFSVHRAVEQSNFTHSMDNKQLLFHASQVKNFVGILSRGLLLPKIVVDDFGGTRSDPGMLGSGIYFGGSSSLSCKYSKPGSCGKKTRIMLVNEVALGNCKEYTVQMKELTDAPDGYHSAKGVGSTDDVTSFFESDEYVVYSPHQQCLRYLVEFSLPEDDESEDNVASIGAAEAAEDAPTKEQEEEKEEGKEKNVSADSVVLSDVQDVANPLDKVKAGLQAEGADVPLQSVHVRAQLIDLAAKVVVMQAYKNNSSVAIEAKYVFPLDDMAAVCGFEAFINGKHIVGQVKEKEQAHREYREAIAKGHGAYLMDEETPDVFTVSVGNLPPGASVLIKITYVSELVVEGEHVLFSLPGSVAPWKQEAALDENIQTDVEKVKVKEQSKNFSVQISVEMPFDIKQIESPTHKIKTKQTASMATVELCAGSSLGSGFQLQVGLAEIHVPRMWVEEDDHGHHACMLTFYPEFEVDNISDNEIVFMLDLSNSMKGDALVCAKKILLLLLHHLPQKCLFNIFTFGAAYDSLFPTSVPKTKQTLNTANQFIQQCCANMGSTDVWRPLHSLHILSDSAPKVGGADSSTLPPRSVFLVSDGHVTEEAPTLDVIRRGVRNSRIFTFGVDSTANKHFLRSMAHVGAGCVEFFDPKTKSKWERKVKAQLDKAFQPALTSVQVQWKQFDDDAPKPIQAPQELMSLFSGSRQVVYGFVPHCKQAALQARIGGKEVETMVSTTDLGMTKGKTLHQLTARAIIRDWTDGSLDSNRMEHEIVKRDRKSYIINISKEYSIVSQFTSFVAIEEREKGEKFDTQKGPSIEKLVAKEGVDKLGYMGWMVDQGRDPRQEALDLVAETLKKMSRSSSKESEELCVKTLKDTEGILGAADAQRMLVVKRLLDLYSQNRQYERAYEMAKPIRQKLELSFSADASQRLAELEKAVERIRVKEKLLQSTKPSHEEERKQLKLSMIRSLRCKRASPRAVPATEPHPQVETTSNLSAVEKDGGKNTGLELAKWHAYVATSLAMDYGSDKVVEREGVTPASDLRPVTILRKPVIRRGCGAPTTTTVSSHRIPVPRASLRGHLRVAHSAEFERASQRPPSSSASLPSQPVKPVPKRRVLPSSRLPPLENQPLPMQRSSSSELKPKVIGDVGKQGSTTSVSSINSEGSVGVNAGYSYIRPMDSPVSSTSSGSADAHQELLEPRSTLGFTRRNAQRSPHRRPTLNPRPASDDVTSGNASEEVEGAPKELPPETPPPPGPGSSESMSPERAPPPLPLVPSSSSGLQSTFPEGTLPPRPPKVSYARSMTPVATRRAPPRFSYMGMSRRDPMERQQQQDSRATEERDTATITMETERLGGEPEPEDMPSSVVLPLVKMRCASRGLGVASISYATHDFTKNASSSTPLTSSDQQPQLMHRVSIPQVSGSTASDSYVALDFAVSASCSAPLTSSVQRPLIYPRSIGSREPLHSRYPVARGHRYHPQEAMASVPPPVPPRTYSTASTTEQSFKRSERSPPPPPPPASAPLLSNQMPSIPAPQKASGSRKVPRPWSAALPSGAETVLGKKGEPPSTQPTRATEVMERSEGMEVQRSIPSRRPVLFRKSLKSTCADVTLSEPGKELEVGDEDEDEDEDMYDEDVYEFDELSSAVYCFTHDPSHVTFEQVLQRGKKLDDLVQKTDMLSGTSKAEEALYRTRNLYTFEEEEKKVAWTFSDTTLSNLSEIFAAQLEDGSWTIKSLSLVGLQPSKLEEHLLSLGAKSLGKVARLVLFKLLTTLLILKCLSVQTGHNFPVRFSPKVALSNEDAVMPTEFKWKVMKAVEFVVTADKKYPSLYFRLELGSSWEEVLNHPEKLLHP